MSADLRALEDLLRRASSARRPRRNPPGLLEIDYRLTDYREFRRIMIAALEVVEVPARGTHLPIRPLAGANLDPETDWMIALIDAWATVGDILTFYQTRIANEGYLSTAREQISSELLTRMLGTRRGAGALSSSAHSKQVSPVLPPATIEVVSQAPVVPSRLGRSGPVVPTPGAATAVPLPARAKDPTQPYQFVVDPGAAAVTDVAFQIQPNRATTGQALIRAGTAIRSHSVDGSMPLVFETGADLDARIAHNAIAAFSAPEQVAPTLTSTSVGLTLAGTATGLRPGSSILVFGTPSSSAAPSWLYGKLVTVEPNQTLGNTLVTWTAPQADGTGGLLNQSALGDDQLDALSVYGFSRALAPFGHDAGALSAAPLATQIALSVSGGVSLWRMTSGSPAWSRLNEGLPTSALSALAIGGEGTLWIGGAFGVAYLPPGASGSWTLMSSGLGSAAVISLTVADDGSLWAGTTNGQVFRTPGRGQGWSAIAGSFTVVNGAPAKTSLPRTPITSIQPYITKPRSATDGDGALPPAAALAGTGLGVFGNPLDSSGWYTDNRNIKGSNGSSASSPYTSSPLVDLKVLGPGASPEAQGSSGYAIAASPDGIAPFPWYPFDPLPNTNSAAVAPSLSSPSNLPPVDTFQPFPGEVVVEVIFFTLDGETGLMVLTNKGPWRWSPTTTTTTAGTETTTTTTSAFVPVTRGLAGSPLKSIAAVPDGAQKAVGGVVVGNDGSRVWVLDPGDWQWTVVDGFEGLESDRPPAPTPSIATLVAAGPGGLLLAAAPLTLAAEWPDFRVVQTEQDEDGNVSTWIDLDSKPFDVAPGSWVVVAAPAAVQEPGVPESVSVFQLVSSTVAYRDGEGAYGQPGRVFRLFVSDAGQRPCSSPRSADVLAVSFALAVYKPMIADDRPVCGAEIDLAGILDSLDESQRVNQRHATRLLAFTGQRARLCVTMTGGLWCTPAASTAPPCWSEQGLGFQTVTALLELDGELWVGTESSGVRARTAAGSWVDRSQGLAGADEPPPRIIALAGSAGGLVVATSSGAASWNPARGAWVNIPELTGDQPLSLLVDEPAGGPITWWMGTAKSGLWTSADGVHFVPAPRAATLVGRAINALAMAAGALLAGTPDGVYRYPSATAPGQSDVELVAKLPATALAGSGGALLIGTASQGAWLIDDLDAKSLPRCARLPATQITVLACHGKRFYAGTGGAGVYGSDDATSWAAMPIGVPADVRSLTVTRAGDLYAGAAEGAQLLSDSGAVAGELAYSDKLVLPDGFSAELFQGLVSARLRSAFNDAKVPLPADARVSTLDKQGRWLLTSNSDASAPVYILFRDNLLRIVVIQANTIPVVIGPWSGSVAAGALRKVTLKDGELEGNLLLGDGQWTLRPPEAGDAPVSEVKGLSGVKYDYTTSATIITIQAPLDNTYARSTVRVSANVVRASQGETVNPEILGNGNAGVPNQSFTLRYAPLTFLPVPPPEYRRSTLTITVNNVEWQEVASLAGAGPNDRVYEVAINHEGRATVTFGDGEHGARLPTGIQNVVASYRYGLGARGDVSAGTLDILLSAPPGVKSVTNPIPATQGVDPSPDASIRRDVPRAARAGNRIVSLADHADLAISYPGVRQATVAKVRASQRTWIVVTVGFKSDVPDHEISVRASALQRAITGAQAQPAPPVSVMVAPLSYFWLSATVRIARSVVPEDARTQVFDALFARWSAFSANIGEDVRPAAVEAVIQAVPGVQGVRVTSLSPTGEARDGRQVLPATPAHYDAKTKRLVPANLLVIDPASAAPRSTPPSVFVKGGITLHVSGGHQEVDP
ncbi:hypothetical protein WMF04_23885 [Sorangium sp. So ce260]|uniref:hypothetical protein n=1 Tax=Sorangium sp. So ce260 TaxID=3133291 RepID=UPI003F5DD1AA